MRSQAQEISEQRLKVCRTCLLTRLPEKWNRTARTGRHMSRKPTTQELVEKPGRGSLRARWGEVESKGKSEQLYAHFVVRRKVYGRRFVGAGALHCHLLRFKLNLMLFGFADDRSAEILIRALRSQPDSASDLRREVPHILVQLEVGQLARSDPPARDAGQRKNRQSEDEFGFSHHDNPFSPVTKSELFALLCWLECEDNCLASWSFQLCYIAILLHPSVLVHGRGLDGLDTLLDLRGFFV